MTQLVDREPTSPAQAIQLQERLRPKVNLTKTWECLSVIGAVDCSHAPGATMGAAGIILYRYPELVELSRTVITIGALLRTRVGTRPIVVSPGHLVDLKTALEIVQRCCDGPRIPRPLREADRLVRGRIRAPR